MKMQFFTFLALAGTAAAAVAGTPVKGSGVGEAVELVRPLDSRNALVDAEALGLPLEHAARVGEIGLDVRRLYDLGRPRVAEANPRHPVAGGRFTVEYFPGERFTIEHQQTEGHADGSYTWLGRVESDPNSSFSLTVSGEHVFGRLSAANRVYVTQNRGDRVFVTEPDLLSMPAQCYEDGSDQVPTSDSRAPVLKSLGGSSNVDILVLYSGAVEGRYYPPTLINDAAASMNASFSTTGVTGSVRVVGYKYVAYSEGTVDQAEMGAIRLAMLQATGVFSSVQTWKDDLGADTVLMIFDSSHASGTCGRGFILDRYDGDPALAYAVTGDACIPAFENFSHEVGHNLGGRHDVSGDNGDPTDTPYTYSHGYTDTNSPEFRTIMGSNGTCSLSGCVRLNRWSNPSQNYSVGRPLGVTGDSDMRQSLDATLPVVGAYDDTTATAPGAPSAVTVVRMLCLGANEVTATPSGTGTAGWYELETSTSSGFTSPVLVYRGGEVDTIIDVPGTRYVRMRACNASSCSSYTTGNQTATYTSPCL